MEDREKYFYVQGIGNTGPWEDLEEYFTHSEAVAYAKGYASNKEMGGFRAIRVMCYAHEDGRYIAWIKYKEDV